MARITIEDCLENISDHFALIHLTVRRYQQLNNNSVPLVSSKNKQTVTALREIAEGMVKCREDIQVSMEEQMQEGSQQRNRSQRLDHLSSGLLNFDE